MILNVQYYYNTICDVYLILKNATTRLYICIHKPRSVYDESFTSNIHPLNDNALAPMILLFLFFFPFCVDFFRGLYLISYIELERLAFYFLI